MAGLENIALLTVVTFLPLATALGLVASGVVGRGLPDSFWKSMGLGSTAVTFLFSLLLFAEFDPTVTGFQLVEVDTLSSTGDRITASDRCIVMDDVATSATFDDLTLQACGSTTEAIFRPSLGGSFGGSGGRARRS